MAERISNLGYMSIAKQASALAPATPTDSIPLFEENMVTDGNLNDIQPIYGNKEVTYTTVQGQRSHTGDCTIMAEPNTIAKCFNMLLTSGAVSGTGPYTWPFYLTGNAQYYTVDFSLNNVVKRFIGVQLSDIGPDWNSNEGRAKLSMSALGSFQGREIATVNTTTITLSTTYDPNPNFGLVAGDLVRIYKSSTGATLDTTVASINADGITVVLGASAGSFAAGDFIYLRPATPVLSLQTLTPFLWSNTEFHFDLTAAAALAQTSAQQTRVEQGSTWLVKHDFANKEGEMRSGGLDPASLARTTGGIDLSVKKFFDTPEDVQKFNALTKGACVIRHFAGANRQYELRITINHIKTDKPAGTLKVGGIIYSEVDYHENYDITDSQAFDVKVIDNLAAL